MILVSISSSEDKFIIRLKHRIEYVIENRFGKIKSENVKTAYIFVQLLFAVTKMIFLEISSKFRK